MFSIYNKLLISVFFAFALGALEAQGASGECPKGKVCYCAKAEAVKGLLGNARHAYASACMEYANQTRDSMGLLYASAQDKNLGKAPESKVGSKEAETNCLTKCVGKDLESARKIAEGKGSFAENGQAYGTSVKAAPAAAPKLPSALIKQCGLCPKEQSCFCSDGIEKNGSWKSNCGYLAPGFNRVGEAFTGATKKEAVESCARQCFCAQSSMIRQQANGTWVSK